MKTFKSMLGALALGTAIAVTGVTGGDVTGTSSANAAEMHGKAANDLRVALNGLLSEHVTLAAAATQAALRGRKSNSSSPPGRSTRIRRTSPVPSVRSTAKMRAMRFYRYGASISVSSSTTRRLRPQARRRSRTRQCKIFFSMPRTSVHSSILRRLHCLRTQSPTW